MKTYLAVVLLICVLILVGEAALGRKTRRKQNTQKNNVKTECHKANRFTTECLESTCLLSRYRDDPICVHMCRKEENKKTSMCKMRKNCAENPWATDCLTLTCGYEANKNDCENFCKMNKNKDQDYCKDIRTAFNLRKTRRTTCQSTRYADNCIYQTCLDEAKNPSKKCLDFCKTTQNKYLPVCKLKGYN